MLTPFFGRAPSDEDTYQIAGVGAICGLEFLLGVQQLSAVEAQILMVALYEHLCPLCPVSALSVWNEWIARAVRALGEGETVKLVSARFREQFASLPDVRE